MHANNSTKKHTAAKNQQAAVVQKQMGLQVAITGCNSALTILRIGVNFNHRQVLRIGQGRRVKVVAEVAVSPAPTFHEVVRRLLVFLAVGFAEVMPSIFFR